MNRYPFEEAPKSKHQASEKHQTSNPNEALLIADRRSIVAQISSNLLYRRASSLRDVDFTAYSRNSLALPIANRRYSRLQICATKLAVLCLLATPPLARAFCGF